MLMQFILLRLSCNFLKIFIVWCLVDSISRESQASLNIISHTWWWQGNHKRFFFIFSLGENKHHCYRLCIKYHSKTHFKTQCVNFKVSSSFLMAFEDVVPFFTYNFVLILGTLSDFISLTPETKTAIRFSWSPPSKKFSRLVIAVDNIFRRWDPRVFYILWNFFTNISEDFWGKLQGLLHQL